MYTVASFDGLQEDIYENRTIITSQLLAAEDEKRKQLLCYTKYNTENCIHIFTVIVADMQPVLVNDKIVSGFATAWNRGSQLQEVITC